MTAIRLPKEIKTLVRTLKRELSAEVDVELVPGDDPYPDRYRLAIVSKMFERMTHLKRQDFIWDIINKVLDREHSLAVSMVLAYSPSEMEPLTKKRS
jgi:acid stress-induced BolA-like protein IbaG/YrbA